MAKIKNKLKEIVFNNSFLFMIYSVIKPGSKRYRIESLYKYVKENHLIVKVIDDRNVKEYRRPAANLMEYENWNHEGVIPLLLSRQYISQINNCIVLSNNDGVVVGDLWLNDRIEWDEDGLPLYPPNGTRYISTKIICQDAVVNKTVDKGIFLLKEFTPNYFHFTLEVISRLKSVDDVGIYDEWPLILDSNGKEDVRTLQLLDVMNTKKHPVIWIEPDEVVKVKQLVIPPILAWGARDFKWRNEKKIGIIVDKSVPEVIRSKVFENYHPKKKYNKVYVERGNNRRLLNEDKVKEYLEQNGFEVFNPDKADFWDEVDCFSTAKTIVTVVGAAMTNVLFSKKNTNIIEICPFEYQTVAYTFLKETMGLTNFTIISPQVKQAGLSINKTTFFLSKNQCKKIVKLSE